MDLFTCSTNGNRNESERDPKQGAWFNLPLPSGIYCPDLAVGGDTTHAASASSLVVSCSLFEMPAAATGSGLPCSPVDFKYLSKSIIFLFLAGSLFLAALVACCSFWLLTSKLAALVAVAVVSEFPPRQRGVRGVSIRAAWQAAAARAKGRPTIFPLSIILSRKADCDVC